MSQKRIAIISDTLRFYIVRSMGIWLHFMGLGDLIASAHVKKTTVSSSHFPLKSEIFSLVIFHIKFCFILLFNNGNIMSWNDILNFGCLYPLFQIQKCTSLIFFGGKALVVVIVHPNW